MKTKSEWMQLFSPKQVRQAIWMDLGGALATPINSTSTRHVVQNTVDFLRAMGCEPQILPSEAALASWTPTAAATALTKWRKKLRNAFGVADVSSRGPTMLRSTSEAVDPSKVPLPATPRKGATDDGVFATKGEASPYMQDSHMSSTPTLEIATHLPLANIKPFYGTRDKSEHSMQWLRTFIYEMKGTHAPPNEDGALHWCRQLPRKTRRTWKLLSEAFIKYYCSKFSQSAKARYYSAKREDKEHVCDYLNRLNGYASNAGVQFENGGRDAKDHVEHFLATCDDRNLEDRLCHVWVKSVHDLEDMINDILRHRDRKSNRESSFRRSRSQDDGRRRDARSNEDSRGGYRRERRYHDEDRRKRRRRDNDRRNDRSEDDRRRDRRDGSPYRSRVTLVDALVDVMAEWNVRDSVGARNEGSYAPRRDAGTNEDCFEDGRQHSDEDSHDDYDSNESTGHVAAANDAERRAAAEGTFARTDNQRFRNGGGPSNRERDGRRQYGPCAACESPSYSVHFCYRRCKLCKQVHDAGKCEALHELTKLLKSKVDKKDLSLELQSLLAEPAVDADYLFAFMGKSKRPDDLMNNDRVKPTENGENRDPSLVETGVDEDDDDERDEHPTEALITSLAQVRGPPRNLVRAVKVLPGERLGWWSSKRYDKRMRMRALVMGAVDDARTRILLDTGANVSVISANVAKRLRVREVRDHGRSLEVRGINPGVMETRRRALVKITLGWEQVCEFEMWIMDHRAGVDVVLGIDFMIPAGIRLDLFYGTSRLPDEVMVPLLKSQSVEDNEPYGTQPSCGPTEDLYIPGRAWREFRLPRQRLPRSEFDVWVRRTDKLVPTVTRLRRGQPAWRHGVPSMTPWCYSNKYKEWQVLAYSTCRDETLQGRERHLYEQWLAEQPPAVERRTYPTPRKILPRPPDVPPWPEGRQQAPLDDEYSSPDVHSYADDPRFSESSVEVARADTTDVERAGGSNDGSGDEASASDDSDVPGDSPPSRASCLPVNANSGADSTGQGATYASVEASEARDELSDGGSVTNDDSEGDRDVVAVAETTTWDVLPTGTAAPSLESGETSAAVCSSEVDWGEHDPGPNDVPTEAGTSTADADIELHDSDVSAIDDPEQLLEATYISVMHAMVAEGSDEGDDTLNGVSEHVANEI
ncbi:hypothetical protein PHYSODRAFT_253063 [Phytophthora sojae]|uniref:Peptidase A2 domain-containing protein n=1 Tax=Phytophthora sojae (strain P6497) TaxID=1094619 RepID=G4ZRY3_PHYSP|nr:hypothetical protein PHYSODRAFT_253063 [Phytophthora sojae]EGZ14162.1 hypothetical protein PHYSODRAFT_253063 [Phytophthora sojae]|eukprot:XP_009531591.1 hypothetical protein PHYSODRAFT_253063 [Phytophthora sojae]